MSGPKHLPLIGWSHQELLNELWSHQQSIQNLQRELDRRGGRDEKRHGFAVAVHSPGMISTAYRHYPTASEAYAAAVKAFPEDRDAAPYRVHPVYLGKDDPA